MEYTCKQGTSKRLCQTFIQKSILCASNNFDAESYVEYYNEKIDNLNNSNETIEEIELDEHYLNDQNETV